MAEHFAQSFNEADIEGKHCPRCLAQAYEGALALIAGHLDDEIVTGDVICDPLTMWQMWSTANVLAQLLASHATPIVAIESIRTRLFEVLNFYAGEPPHILRTLEHVSGPVTP